MSINKDKVKIVAFDLDGTLTQHKSKLSPEHKEFLDRLAEKYKLLMVGAGSCRRIFEQMNRYPIDIIGNYGLQYAIYDKESGDIVIKTDYQLPINRESVDARVTALREKHGFCEFVGENVEYHDSGCITFPVLGTKAELADKLAFDPDRKKRRAIYASVAETFSDYTVFVGGTSSFDMAPAPFDKAYALSEYCRERGILHSEVVFVGDDYGIGGNDESVYKADFNFVEIDDYRTLREKLAFLL